MLDRALFCFVIINIGHNVLHIALQQLAKQIDRVGGNVVAIFDCIIGGSRETHLH